MASLCTQYAAETHIPDNVDLRLAVGSTTIISFHPNGEGYWRMSGGVVTLMELFLWFGQEFTAREIFFWYYWAPKIAKKRKHAWGSEDVQAGGQLRKRETNKWGHMR